MEAKAKLRYYRQSPKKVRLIADVIRGQKVTNAMAQLEALPKRAAGAIAKLLASAMANAKDVAKDKTAVQDLIIKEIKVDQGPTYKRFTPRAHGRATMIRKRSSHVSLVLGEKNSDKVISDDALNSQSKTKHKNYSIS